MGLDRPSKNSCLTDFSVVRLDFRPACAQAQGSPAASTPPTPFLSAFPDVSPNGFSASQFGFHHPDTTENNKTPNPNSSASPPWLTALKNIKDYAGFAPAHCSNDTAKQLSSKSGPSKSTVGRRQFLGGRKTTCNNPPSQ